LCLDATAHGIIRKVVAAQMVTLNNVAKKQSPSNYYRKGLTHCQINILRIFLKIIQIVNKYIK